MIHPVGFLDTSEFTAHFIKSWRSKMKDEEHGVQTLLLRSAEHDAALLKDWGSARKIMARLKNEASPYLGGRQGVLGKVFIKLLKPHSWTPWEVDDSAYTQAHVRTMTCLIPNPFAMVYSGVQGSNLMVGQVTVVGQQDPHSELNLGTNAVAWLVADLERPDQD